MSNNEGLTELNFDLAEEAKRPVAPEGVYELEIQSVEKAVSQKGNPMLVVRLSVIDDEHEDDAGNTIRTRGIGIFDNVTLTADAAWKLKQLMSAADVSFTNSQGKTTFNHNELIGRTVRARVNVNPVKRDGEFTGENRNGINRYLLASENA